MGRCSVKKEIHDERKEGRTDERRERETRCVVRDKER